MNVIGDIFSAVFRSCLFSLAHQPIMLLTEIMTLSNVTAEDRIPPIAFHLFSPYTESVFVGSRKKKVNTDCPWSKLTISTSNSKLFMTLSSVLATQYYPKHWAFMAHQ